MECRNCGRAFMIADMPKKYQNYCPDCVFSATTIVSKVGEEE